MQRQHGMRGKLDFFLFSSLWVFNPNEQCSYTHKWLNTDRTKILCDDEVSASFVRLEYGFFWKGWKKNFCYQLLCFFFQFLLRLLLFSCQVGADSVSILSVMYNIMFLLNSFVSVQLHLLVLLLVSRLSDQFGYCWRKYVFSVREFCDLNLH